MGSVSSTRNCVCNILSLVEIWVLPSSGKYVPTTVTVKYYALSLPSHTHIYIYIYVVIYINFWAKVVDIATRYWLEGLGIDFRYMRYFKHLSRSFPASCISDTEIFFTDVNRPGCDVGHPPPPPQPPLQTPPQPPPASPSPLGLHGLF